MSSVTHGLAKSLSRVNHCTQWFTQAMPKNLRRKCSYIEASSTLSEFTIWNLNSEKSEIHCKRKVTMSSSKQSNKSKNSQLPEPKRKKPKQQGSVKSPTKQNHAQDTKKAETREAEGVNWDEYVDGQSRS